jgi:hypothetical protein
MDLANAALGMSLGAAAGVVVGAIVAPGIGVFVGPAVSSVVGAVLGHYERRLEPFMARLIAPRPSAEG